MESKKAKLPFMLRDGADVGFMRSHEASWQAAIFVVVTAAERLHWQKKFFFVQKTKTPTLTVLRKKTEQEIAKISKSYSFIYHDTVKDKDQFKNLLNFFQVFNR